MLRNNHMVEGLPTQYLFYLLCSNCKAPNCPHAICQGGRRGEVPAWYEGGPTVSYLPLPIPDTSRPWGSSCSDCKGCCYGHFLKPVEALTSTHKPMSEPPSVILGTAFKKLKGKAASDSDVEKLARRTLLPPDEVRLWFSHLETVSDNRKRGAQKAAETRRLRKGAAGTWWAAVGIWCMLLWCLPWNSTLSTQTQCRSGSDCDACDRWYHFTCVGLTSELWRMFLNLNPFSFVYNIVFQWRLLIVSNCTLIICVWQWTSPYTCSLIILGRTLGPR